MFVNYMIYLLVVCGSLCVCVYGDLHTLPLIPVSMCVGLSQQSWQGQSQAGTTHEGVEEELGGGVVCLVWVCYTLAHSDDVCIC